MRRTENPEYVVRLREAPLEKDSRTRQISVLATVLCMELVAQLAERQVVALVAVGSTPIKLPNASITQILAKVVQHHCNKQVIAPQKKGFSLGIFA